MQHIGQETVIEVGGTKYTLSRFSRSLLKKFIEWADTQLGNPLDQVRDKLAGFPVAMQEIIVKDALERQRLRKSVNSPEIEAIMQSPDGVTYLLHLHLKQHHPDLTYHDAESLYDRATIEHGLTYIEQALANCAGRMVETESEAEKRALREMGALPASTFPATVKT